MSKNVNTITKALIKSGLFIIENDYTFHYFSSDAGNEMIFRRGCNSKSYYFANAYIVPRYYNGDNGVGFLKDIWEKFFEYDSFKKISNNGFEEMIKIILENIETEEEKSEILKVSESEYLQQFKEYRNKRLRSIILRRKKKMVDKETARHWYSLI